MYGQRQLKDVNVLAIHAHQGEVWVTRWSINLNKYIYT